MTSVLALPTTTFSGRRFTRAQLARVQETVGMFPNLSRKELAQTICEHLGWKTPRGTNKIDCCLALLETLEAEGMVSLPAKRVADVAPKHSVNLQLAEQGSPIEMTLPKVLPVVLERVTDEQRGKFKASIQAHHYLGYKHQIGSQLGYFIRSKPLGQILGCLLFSSSASWNLPARDGWIGWNETQRKKLLHLVVTQNRFLIFPWVNVPHLASHVLSLAEKQLPSDWAELYKYSPVLLETFVDSTRFSGVSYQAANWQNIGQTNSKTAKEIFVRPLRKDFQLALTKGLQERTLKQRYRNDVKASGTRRVDDAFVALWQKVMHLLHEVAETYDAQWRARHRIIDTLLLMLLIFRLVTSKNKQSYGITIDELWDSCRELQLPLPQKASIAPSSLCNARKKLDESVFQCLNQKVLEAYAQLNAEKFLWLGHRVFAVDGSKINLPRTLIEAGYVLPQKAHYPQGLVSCLYNLKSQLPVDFDLVAHADERRCAAKHLQALRAGDVVVYDRGYFSFLMLHLHMEAGIHAVFRVQSSGSTDIAKFFLGPQTDTVVSLYPSQTTLAEFAKAHPEIQLLPRKVRLVKYTAGGATFALATTLIDSNLVRLADLAELYYSRWGIEEFYKVSKRLFLIEDFHAKFERGIKQELFAHFALITLNRLFAHQADQDINQSDKSQPIDLLTGHSPKASPFKVNFKNCIHVIARKLEPLFLFHRKLTHAVQSAYNFIVRHHQRIRSGRSYERKSMRPETKWRLSGKKRSKLTEAHSAAAASVPA